MAQIKRPIACESWRIRATGLFLSKLLRKAVACMIVVILLPLSSNASTCQGRFVNPITDICWSCILPISIGGLVIGKGVVPKRRDTKNPTSPICACSKGGQPIPIPGLSVGFWEPVRLIDVTRTPYCMTNLGGIAIGSDNKRISSFDKSYGTRAQHHSFYHLHYYIYPLIYWLELITDFMCLDTVNKGIDK